jgi:hypothetical protein
MRNLSGQQKAALRGKLTGAQTLLRGYKQRQEELSLALAHTKNSKVIESLDSQIADALLGAERQEELIKNYKADLAKSELPALSPEEF